MARVAKLPEQTEPAPVKKERKPAGKKAKATEPKVVKAAEFIPEPEPEAKATEPAVPETQDPEPAQPEPSKFSVFDKQGIAARKDYSEFIYDAELAVYKHQVRIAYCIENNLPLEFVVVQ